jgi:hypothetical protein
MKALDLIADIFARPQRGAAPDLRRITTGQLDLLLELIGEDQHAGAVQRGLGRSVVWTPPGTQKYVVTEDARGDKHTLMRLRAVDAAAIGMLF